MRGDRSPRVGGRPALRHDARTLRATATVLLDALGARLMKAPAAEWADRLRPLGIAVGPVADLGDVLDGELVRARDGHLGRDRRRAVALGGEPHPVRRRRREYRPAPACTSTPQTSWSGPTKSRVRRRSRRRPLHSWGSTDTSGPSRRRPRRPSTALFTRMVADPLSRWAMHVAQLPPRTRRAGSSRRAGRPRGSCRPAW